VAKKIISNNRKASYEYHLQSNFEAGIVLTGTEVKAIRNQEINLSDSFCQFLNQDELFVRNMHVGRYQPGSYNNHESKRDRKLLLNKSELKKIKSKLKEKGIALIPVKIYLNERNIIKLEIALAKGKKLYDKRNTIKERDIKREMMRK